MRVVRKTFPPNTPTPMRMRPNTGLYGRRVGSSPPGRSKAVTIRRGRR